MLKSTNSRLKLKRTNAVSNKFNYVRHTNNYLINTELLLTKLISPNTKLNIYYEN